jgi:hypothetical protein
MRTLACAALSAALCLLFFGPAISSAQAAAPQWTVTAVSRPSFFKPFEVGVEAEDSYQVTLTNTGAATANGGSAPIEITDELPAALSLDPAGASGNALVAGDPKVSDGPPLACAHLTCTFTGAVAPDQTLVLTFPVDVSPATPESVTNVVRVTGGGAPDASVSTPTPISTGPAAFGIAPGSATTALSSLQAGAHPDITNTIGFNTVNPRGALAKDFKNVVFDLPPGFASDFLDTEACPVAVFLVAECPIPSQIGVTAVTVTGGIVGSLSEPVYNLEPGPGEVGKLGFTVAGNFNVEGSIRLRPNDYGAEVSFEDTNQVQTEIDDVSLTVWGVPASPIHDPLRARAHQGGVIFGNPSDAALTPFFTNPTSCGTAPSVSTFSVNSWQEPGVQVHEAMPFGPIVGCDRLTIEPSAEAQTTSSSAESATGLNFHINSPQHYENAEGLVASHLDDVRVTLPAGMSLNPSAGSGLGSCTTAQLAYEGSTAEPVAGLGCPEESKIGTIKVKSPALAEEASGSLFVARPFENPFDSLLALYLVARIPDRGVVVTAAGEVHADPGSGQLTTTFTENPQLPFSDFTLAFRQGATSPLVTPPICGHFTAASLLTPWSVPTQEHLLTSSFDITSGVGGGACPGGGVPPFHPGLVAGTVNNSAGSYSPFYARISREDGEQEITRFSIKLPPGVLANLSGVTRCSEAQIARARSLEHEQGGAEEEAHPSCPASSEVGHTLVEAGVGSVLAQAPGKLYLAGPYHGAQLSIVSITAARVGPFDLGTVVVRQALKIDPETLAVSAEGAASDPIPHIIDGIPVHARNIRIYVDRPHFALNPTSCEPTSTASTVLGSGKDFTSEADDQPVTVTSRFQAAGCAALAFKPKLRLQLRGGKTRRGGLPGLKATVTYPRQGAYANIAKAQVTLPPSEFLEQGHLKNVCPRSVWIQGTVPGEKCPANSIYGHARATTPLLSEPLEGPVYLRTGYGTRLPELVAALNAQEINVDVVGEIDSVHQKGSEVSLLRNTFKTVPDAPVSRFELELKGGKKGLLVNSTNICKGTHKALAAFTGQNGALGESEPKLEVGACKKGHGKKGKGKKGGGGKKKAHAKGGKGA